MSEPTSDELQACEEFKLVKKYTDVLQELVHSVRNGGLTWESAMSYAMLLGREWQREIDSTELPRE